MDVQVREAAVVKAAAVKAAAARGDAAAVREAQVCLVDVDGEGEGLDRSVVVAFPAGREGGTRDAVQ